MSHRAAVLVQVVYRLRQAAWRLCAHFSRLHVLSSAVLVSSANGQSDTFIDRRQADDLRVVSYNVLFDTIFPSVNALQAAKFERVVHALDADVWNLQEINRPASSVVTLLNTIAPLPGGATWYAHKGGDNVIASRFPMSLTATNTLPAEDLAGIALIDLPDDQYAKDLYVMNNHFTCCALMEPPDPLDPNERRRQREADALVNWMRDAREPGGLVNLLKNTPMLVAGDLNIIADPNVYDPLGTLLTGDIYFEANYGGDSPPDWDGTPLADVHPLHNGRGPEDYTWRNDLTIFDPGRLDYVLYTDSVMRQVHKFVLNTVFMTPGERLATGLLELDITVDQLGQNYDHLPVVVDFRIVPEAATWVQASIALLLLSCGGMRISRPGKRPVSALH